MFIDRKEHQLLKDKLDRSVQKGVGATILITGEPGIGKSTLIDYFLESCDQNYHQNILTATGRCSDIDGVSRGYLPWKEVLIELDADKAAGKDKEKRTDFKKIVKSIFDDTGADWIQNIPLVGSISSAIIDTAKSIKKTEQLDLVTGNMRSLDFRERLTNIANECTGVWLGTIPVAGGLASAIFKTAQSLQSSKKNLFLKNQQDFFELVMNKLRKFADQNPVVVFIDDLHWADVSSLNLFYYLAKNLKDKPYPLLLIGSYRPQEVREGRLNPQTGELNRHPLTEKVNNLNRYDAVEEIALEHFSQSQLRKLFDEKFTSHDLNDVFFEQFKMLTNGNPLFVQESLNILIERDLISKKNGTYGLNLQSDQTISNIFSHFPKTIKGVLKERFERLPIELQELLQIAAVQGDDFSLEILGSVLEESTLKLHGKIDLLMNKYQLVEKVNITYDKLVKIYRFIHNLAQKYIYYELGIEYRFEIHKQVAANIKSYLVDSTTHPIAETYGFHLGVGYQIIDETGRIIFKGNTDNQSILNEYLQLQMDLASRYEQEYSNNEALNKHDLIIELSRCTGKQETEIDYLLKKGELLQNSGDWGKSEDIRKKALACAVELNDMQRIGRANLAIGTIVLYIEQDYKAALEHFQIALETSEESDDFTSVGNAAKSIGNTYLRMGQFDNAKLHYDKLLAICERSNNKRQIANANNNIGEVHRYQGEYDAAMNCYNKAISQAEEIEDKRSKSIPLSNKGLIYISIEEYGKALECFEAARRINLEIGFKTILSENYIGKSEALFHQKSLDVAAETIVDGLLIAEEAGRKDVLFQGRILSAKINFASGNKQEALNQLIQMLEHTKKEYECAVLNFEIWQMITKFDRFESENLDIESCRSTALQLFQDLYKRFPDIEYKRNIKMLHN